MFGGPIEINLAFPVETRNWVGLIMTPCSIESPVIPPEEINVIVKGFIN